MHKIRHLLQGLGLSAVAGIVTGGVIFLFKLASTAAMGLAAYAYDCLPLPFLLLGAAVLGLLSAFLLKYAKDCRGGGIPAAAVSVRGLAPMRWVQSLIGMFTASMLSYLGGVPLGNEGPSVQMGAAAGKGTTELLGKRCSSWEKHVMGGSAGAGFAVATGAPLAGIVFALEEMHKKLSATLIITAVVSVGSAALTDKLLFAAFHVHGHGFGFETVGMMPLAQLWQPLLLGLVCGLVSVAFALLYHGLHKWDLLKKIPFGVKIAGVFVCVAVLGFFSRDFIGSGSGLIDRILAGEGAVVLLALALLVRGTIMIFANHEGVSGGTFIPTLALGALVAALFAQLLPVEGTHYGTMIAVGMTAFLAASNRTPLTAVLYAVEVLCGFGNLPAIIIGTAAAFFAAKLTGVEEYAEVAIEGRAKAAAQKG